MHRCTCARAVETVTLQLLSLFMHSCCALPVVHASRVLDAQVTAQGTSHTVALHTASCLSACPGQGYG